MLVEARFKFYGMLENLQTMFKWVVSPQKGNEVEQIEREVSDFLGQTNFKFTTQCRSAIYLAVKHVINEKQNEIIVPAYTIYDVLNMIIAAGGTPVLVDVSESSGNIDINSFETAITKQTAAILVPHLHGIPADAAFNSQIVRCQQNIIHRGRRRRTVVGLMAKELVRLAYFCL